MEAGAELRYAGEKAGERVPERGEEAPISGDVCALLSGDSREGDEDKEEEDDGGARPHSVRLGVLEHEDLQGRWGSATMAGASGPSEVVCSCQGERQAKAWLRKGAGADVRMWLLCPTWKRAEVVARDAVCCRAELEAVGRGATASAARLSDGTAVALGRAEHGDPWDGSCDGLRATRSLNLRQVLARGALSALNEGVM
jgi:hypothetical protein